MEFPSDHKRIEKTKLADSELKEWKGSSDMYFPVSKEGIYLQQDGFRQFSSVKIWMQHKDQLKNGLGTDTFPIHQQADVCNAFISLKNISLGKLKRNFNFMNPLPCMKAFSMCTFHTSCFIRQDGHVYLYLRTSV
jgi:hypothetical protein